MEEENDEFEAKSRAASDRIIELEANVGHLEQQLSPAQRASNEQAAADDTVHDSQSAAHLAAVMKKLDEARDTERKVGNGCHLHTS